MRNKGIGYIISVLFMAFVLLFMGYNGFRYFYKPIETEITYEYTIADKEKTKALMVREEEILPFPRPDDVFDYTVDDGDVVVAKTVVAKTYQNEDALFNKSKTAELDKKIQALQNASKSSSSLKEIENLTAQINKSVGNAVVSSVRRDLEKIGETYEALNFFLAKKYVMNGGKDLSSHIAELETERGNYAGGFTAKENIAAGKSGYFSSFTDGFEEEISPLSLKDKSFEELENLFSVCQETKSTNNLGKVVKDHNWMALCITDVKKQDNLVVGEKVTLDFKEKNCRDLPATVVDIVKNKDKSKMAVVLKCNRINEDILAKRISDVTISSKSFRGYKVNKNALRFIDNKEGVYVIEGGVAVFKEIDVIYSSDNYVICAPDMGEGYLGIFDEVIVKGTDIYNGKLIETM